MNDSAPLLNHARPDPRFGIGMQPQSYQLSDRPGPGSDAGVHFDNPYGNGPQEESNVRYGPLPSRIVRRNRTQKRVP